METQLKSGRCQKKCWSMVLVLLEDFDIINFDINNFDIINFEIINTMSSARDDFLSSMSSPHTPSPDNSPITLDHHRHHGLSLPSSLSIIHHLYFSPPLSNSSVIVIYSTIIIITVSGIGFLILPSP
eukprot:m.35289 g.35289  ORF g.35289 m.35289 type:complete len:127 (+) comp17112_c0_seq1:2866-3246(+)